MSSTVLVSADTTRVTARPGLTTGQARRARTKCNDASVDAAKNPEYLRDLATAVEEFRELVEKFVALHIFNDGLARGLAPALFPRDDVDPAEISRVGSLTARAAGRAAGATPLTNVYYMVEGAGRIDPIATWHSMTQPKPVVEPVNVLDACDQMIGRLEGMARKADAETPPELGVRAMHPLVWGAAAGLWRGGHYREAVAGAAEALVTHVKGLSNRRDVPETSIWQQAFSERPPEPGKPRLRWPGDPSDRAVKAMNDGLRQFGPGAQMTIRNGAAHSTEQLGEQQALERLAVLSLLARWVDQCELVDDVGPAESS